MTDRTSLIVTVSTITAALVAVVPGATDICAQAPAVDGHEIGRRAIAYRQSIKSGVVEIDSSLKKRGKDAKNAVYRISFDGDKCRVVATHKYDGDWKKGETYQKTFVFAGDGKVLEFSDEQLADGGVLAGAVRRDSKIARLRAAPDPK